MIGSLAAVAKAALHACGTAALAAMVMYDVAVYAAASTGMLLLTVAQSTWPAALAASARLKQLAQLFALVHMLEGSIEVTSFVEMLVAPLMVSFIVGKAGKMRGGALLGSWCSALRQQWAVTLHAAGVHWYRYKCRDTSQIAHLMQVEAMHKRLEQFPTTVSGI